MGFLKKSYSRSPVVLGILEGRKRISYSNALVNGNCKFWCFRVFVDACGLSGAAARTGNFMIITRNKDKKY